MFKYSAVAGALLMSASAQSATMSYYLNQSNSLPDGVNYLQVTISDENIAGDIDFSVQVLSDAFSVSGDNFGMQTFAFNYDLGLTIDAANIANINPSTWSISEDQNAGGGFGRFEFQLSGTGASRTELLAFSISGVDGDSIDSYALGSMLNPGADEFFAAHVAGFDMTNGVTSAQFAGSTPAPVPVPAAFILFGSGLIGLAGFIRRRQS